MRELCIVSHGPCVMEGGYCIHCGGQGKYLAPSTAIGVLPSAAHVSACPKCSEPRGEGRHCPICRYDYRTQLAFDAASYPLVLPAGWKAKAEHLVVIVMRDNEGGGRAEMQRVRIVPPARLELGRGSMTGMDGPGRLSIADYGVSRSHLSINFAAIGKAECTDLGSSNGSLLDGVAMQPHVTCSLGRDCILIIGQSTAVRLVMEVSTP